MIYNGRAVVLPITAKNKRISAGRGADISDIPHAVKPAENAEKAAETKLAAKKPRATTKTAAKRRTK